MRLALVIVIAPAIVHAEPYDQRLATRLAIGADGAYSAGLYGGLAVGASWRFVAVELAGHRSPGINIGGHNGWHAMIGAHHHFKLEGKWWLGAAVMGGYRHYTREPAEGVRAGISAVAAELAAEATWWRDAGFGIELRIAGRTTFPVAWDDEFFTDPSRAEGVELSAGLAWRR